MLRKLIREEWSTAVEIQTDENGWADVSGFKGDYVAFANGMTGRFRLESGQGKRAEKADRPETVILCREAGKAES